MEFSSTDRLVRVAPLQLTTLPDYPSFIGPSSYSTYRMVVHGLNRSALEPCGTQVPRCARSGINTLGFVLLRTASARRIKTS